MPLVRGTGSGKAGRLDPQGFGQVRGIGPDHVSDQGDLLVSECPRLLGRVPRDAGENSTKCRRPLDLVLRDAGKTGGMPQPDWCDIAS